MEHCLLFVQLKRIWFEATWVLFSISLNDEQILWSVFMTGSKTPGMSDKEMYLDSTILIFDYQVLCCAKDNSFHCQQTVRKQCY